MIEKTSEQMNREDLENLVTRTSVNHVAGPATVERSPATALLDDEAFERLNAKPPMAKRPWIRVGVVSTISFCAIFSTGALFRGNLNVTPNTVVEDQTEGAIESSRPEADELARLRAENATLKRNMGIASQSLNQAELDALNAEPVAVTPTPSTTEAESTSASAVAVQPAPAATTSPTRASAMNTITYRAPAPRPPARTTSATPQVVRTTQPSRTAEQPRQPSEPVDPYTMRERLSNLGSYGQPVSLASYSATQPRQPQNIVVSVEQPQAQTVAHHPSIRHEVSAQAPVESQEYYQAVAAVLGIPVAEVARLETPAPAVAILPGEVFDAELINGVSWSEGDQPEIALETIENLSVEGNVLIPAGTRMLAVLVGIDDAGGASFDITQIFMQETEVNIPPGSLIIQADDGSMLRASRSGDQRGNSNLHRAILGSTLNVLDNVIDSDGSLIGDVAGGIGEAVLENQKDRFDADAQRRAAIENSQASIWELTPRRVQIFVSRYIPIGTDNEN